MLPPRPRDFYQAAPDVSAEVRQPDDYLHIQTNPQQFGGQIGQALEQGGQRVEQGSQEVFNAALQYKQMQNATDALNATTSASQELGDAETKFRMLSGNNAVQAYPGFEQQVAAIRQKYAATLKSPQAQLAFDRDFNSISQRSLMNAGIHVGDQAKQAHLNALQSAIKEEQSRVVRYTQTGGEPDFNGIIDKTLMLAHEQGLDQDSANALVQRNTGDAVKDMIVARVAQGDTKGAAAVLSKALSAQAPGTNLPLLDAAHQATLSQMIEQRQTLDANRALTQQMRSLALQDKQQREAAEASGNKFVTAILKDPTQVDPAAIASDPSLKYEQKWSITQMLNAKLAQEQGGDTTKKYGPGFWDAYKAIHLPDNDPNRITSPFQLYNMAGPHGSLTIEGVDRLTKELSGRGTPDGVANSKIQDGALAYIKHQLSFSADYGTVKIRDPKGEDAFNIGALPAFFKYWDDGIKAGKSPAELASKDELDKLIKPFMRKPADLMKDRLEAGVEAPAAAAAAAPKIVPPKVGDVQDGYAFKGGDPADPKSWEEVPQAPLAR